MKATGALKGKHQRALDSTVLDGAVATQDTVTLLIGAVRAVTREVPGADRVASVQCTAHDYTDPGKPRIAWNDEQARVDLVDALVGDALRLLGHLPEQQLGERAANAVGILALIAGQDVEPADDSDGRDGRWRITRGTAYDRVSTIHPPPGTCTRPAATSRTASRPTAPSSRRTGLYTAVSLRPGTGTEHHEAAVGIDLLAGENQPLDVFGDTAYSTGDARQHLQHGSTPAPPPLTANADQPRTHPQ